MFTGVDIQNQETQSQDLIWISEPEIMETSETYRETDPEDQMIIVAEAGQEVQLPGGSESTAEAPLTSIIQDYQTEEQTLQPVQIKVLEEETQVTTTNQDHIALLKEISESLKTIKDQSLENGFETTTEAQIEATTEARKEVIEENIESTTSVYKVLLDKYDRMLTVQEIQARDQQLIGKMSIGISTVILGGLIVYFFLGRIR